MNIKGKNRKIKGVLNSKLTLVVFLAIAVFLANSSIKMYLKSRDTKQYLKAAEQEFSDLKEQYDSSQSDLEYLNSETGTEKEIRSKFDLAREGEKAVVIIDEDMPEIQEPTKKSFFKRLIDWVSF